MKEKAKLKDEAEFWLAYIEHWGEYNDGPVPKRALRLLDYALIELRDYYLEDVQDKSLQEVQNSIH